jgi:DNA-directed RNA polymerase I subunit RPA2
MGKQTMGFPLHSYPRRADNKLYCLRNPQTPMIRNAVYDDFNMDEYPLGTNAVVAVISYTVRKESAALNKNLQRFLTSCVEQGYDMEDAMIINKSANERGFANAHLVTTKVCEFFKY